MVRYVEAAMLVLMLGVPLGIFINRAHLKMGIGGRVIQFAGLSWVIGAAVILTFEGKLEGVAGTLLGAVAGYLFGKGGEDKPGPTTGGL